MFKKSYKGKMFSQDISPKDWKNEVGYNVRVVNSAEQDQKNLDTVQKLGAIKQLYPNNLPLARILEEKLLNIANVSPEQKKEVMDYEKQAAQQAQQQPQPGQPGQAPNPAQQPQPVTPQPQYA